MFIFSDKFAVLCKKTSKMSKDNITKITSLTQIFSAFGAGKPKHPLIGIIDMAGFSTPKAMLHQKTISEFYCVILKDGNCGMEYGRGKYDFEEGVLRFLGPNQLVSATSSTPSTYGFMLIFHPDLIRQFPLGKEILRYSFFDYSANEALHLSEKEEKILLDCVQNIQDELDQNIDKHSQELLVTNIQLLLNYSNRFYERQFITRTNSNSDVVSKVEALIKQYYLDKKQLKEGTPSPHYFAEKVHLSTNYLSDLLKKETGRSTKEHVDDYVVELAKTQLVNSDDTVNEIAYDLGFNYPHYFSRLFKKKTGTSPNEFRSKILN